ncbi:MAG: LytTR family DNA-binding domain-containing protein [Acidobacteriota bacterium]
MPLRTVIVDDEPLARERLRQLCRTERDLELVGECGDGQAAVEAIETLHPDLVFLDVRMPGVDGFGVLEAVGGERFPGVVFVTAYDEYAVRAFDVHAVDYLLKPVSRERFSRAVDRVRSHGADGLSEKLVALLGDLRREERYLERLLIRSGGRIVLVKVEDIDWIDGAGNYLKVHVGREAYLLRHTMAGIEERLDPRRFLRIHRSTIVHVDRIVELQTAYSGEYVAVLRNGTRLVISRSYRGKLEELAGRVEAAAS